MISREDAQTTLEIALRSGADFGELYVEDSEFYTMQLADSRIDSAAYSRLRGAGLHLLSGLKSVYMHTCDVTREGLHAMAALSSVALPGDNRMHHHIAQDDYAQPVHQYVRLPARVETLKNIDDAARSVSAEITQVTATLSESDQRVYIFNSLGGFAQDSRVRSRIAVQVVASRGNEVQTGYGAPGFSLPMDMALQRMDIERTARMAASSAVTMLHAPLCPACVAPVVIDGGFGGVIFHEACGHSLESTSVAKGNSVFCGKLGQRIASERVTAIDDATLRSEWGSVNIDDEGMITRSNVLIDKGILKMYMIDRLGARRMQTEPTGNARRQSYAYAPASRMTNTFIAPGADDEQEMIASLGEGLWAKNMGGGSVNPLTGEFNFAVREGYWIKDGKIRHPVRGATLIGKGSDVLTCIERVGRKLFLGAGMCGSVSGSVPTSVGQPRIRVSSMTVGGKGEDK